MRRQHAGAALEAGARYVVGTTGWDDREPEIREPGRSSPAAALVHAANFSLGREPLLPGRAATRPRSVARFPDYDPYILEKHHRQKKDAPSGTAKVLAGYRARPRRRPPQAGEPAHRPDGPLADDRFHVSSVRAGGIVGEHTVGFDSGGDEILLEHRARNRRGFALGAVLAAEWIVGQQRLHTFEDVVDDLAAPAPSPRP